MAVSLGHLYRPPNYFDSVTHYSQVKPNHIMNACLYNVSLGMVLLLKATYIGQQSLTISMNQFFSLPVVLMLIVFWQSLNPLSVHRRGQSSLGFDLNF